MNNILVISGPSASGKSTLVSMLIKAFDELVFSVSHTTRSPRQNEIEGKDYYFVSEETFSQMIERGEFVEWAKVHDNLYGTSEKEIVSKAGKNKFLILDIDVQGA